MDKKIIYIVTYEHKEQIIWSDSEGSAKDCYITPAKVKPEGEEVDYTTLHEDDEKRKNAEAKQLNLDDDYKIIGDWEDVVKIKLLKNNKPYSLTKDYPIAL